MKPSRFGCVLVWVAVLGSCARQPELAPSARYLVGEAYQSAGSWFYPHEDFQLDSTGLAYVAASAPGLTANGERVDPTAMTAAHATLQLPTVARITNLETGLQVLVRINDRGPGPHRLLGLSPRAANRLGQAPGSVARIRLQVEAEASQALRDSLRGNVPAGVTSAPRGAVAAETLAPPSGIAQSTPGRTAPQVSITLASTSGPAVLDPLPDSVVQVTPQPGELWLRAGEFGQPGPARVVQARLGALGVAIERVGQGRSEAYRLRSGPYATVADADMALDRATRAGVTDARIVVE